MLHGFTLLNPDLESKSYWQAANSVRFMVGSNYAYVQTNAAVLIAATIRYRLTHP